MNCIQNSSFAFVSAFEEIDSTDSLSQQPLDIIRKVFGYLSPIELAKCSEVSRRWKRLTSDPVLWNAFDLKKISPLLKVFIESDWISHFDLSSFGLTIEDAPLLDKRQTIPALKRCISSLPIEGNAGVTLLTIPKGLTFNKLLKLAQSPKMGHSTPVRDIWKRISEEIGDIPVDNTYRIAITNNVFENSRNRSKSDQKVLANVNGCEIPKVLEVTALLVVTFIRSGERLYSNSTYSRCVEQLAGFRSIVGFVSDGLNVDLDFYLDSESSGVGGVCHFNDSCYKHGSYSHFQCSVN